MKITNEEHPFHNYIYKNNENLSQLENCPLCSKKGVPHSAYNIITDLGFVEGFQPVRLWKYCSNCNHIYAENHPTNLGDILTRSNPGHYLEPRLKQLRNFGEIMKFLNKKANGDKLLEIGVGSGTMLAVAMEYGFNVSGIDIRPSYTRAMNDLLEENVFAVDFLDFNTDQKYDVICMGDVLEHFISPVDAIEKANRLLNNGGILWISTPNFESAFTKLKEDKDPMWRTTQHINYFSYQSLEKVLNENDFEVLDYKMSKNYNGSMEVTSIKNSYK